MPALLIMYPGCTAFELYAVAELLHEETRVVVTSPKGRPIDSGGLRLASNIAFEDIDPAAVTLAAVAGGDIASVYDDARLFSLLRGLADSSAVLGGICNGAWLLARAGVLEGKRSTHTCVPKYAPPEILERAAPDFESCVFVDEDVVVEDDLITAKPWAYVEFATAMGRRAGLLDEAAVTELNAYYRGRPSFG